MTPQFRLLLVLALSFGLCASVFAAELPYEATWDRPTTRTDGSPLDASVPLTYELYVDAVPGQEWTLITTTTALAHSGTVTVADGEPGARFCVVAVETPQLYSDCSEEVIKLLPRERRFPDPAPFPSWPEVVEGLSVQ
jgi:hypothetical protein